MIQQKFPLLESSLVRLRALEPDDADLLYEVENDVAQWDVADTVAPYSREALLQYALTYDADPFRAGQLRLIIESKSDGSPAGIIDLYSISGRHLHAFAGIYILPAYRRQGLAGHALKILAEYSSRVLGLHSLAAKINESNRASISLFKKAGYELAGTLRDWVASHESSTLLIYQILLAR